VRVFVLSSDWWQYLEKIVSPFYWKKVDKCSDNIVNVNFVHMLVTRGGITFDFLYCRAVVFILVISSLSNACVSVSKSSRGIWSTYPDFRSEWLPNLTGTCLSTDTSAVKLHKDLTRFTADCDPDCEKMPYLAVLKNLKNPGFRSGCKLLSKCTQFFLVRRCICGKILKIRWEIFWRKVGNRRANKTNRQKQGIT